jgi:hypothetical protein
MSKNKSTILPLDKTKEYRMNKKINKSKIRSGQKSKSSLIYPEDNNFNELSSGDFDINIKSKNSNKDENLDENEDLDKSELKNLTDVVNNKMNFSDRSSVDTETQKILLNDVQEEEEEYEEFDPNYFEPVLFIKK